MAAARILPFGDSALLVTLGERISPTLNRRAHSIAAAATAELAPADGWGSPVPGYASVLVPYDAALLDAEGARERLARLVGDALSRPDPAWPSSRTIEIPTRYGGPDGPDLEEVAARLGLSPREVVAIHSRARYHVFILGFVPGFAYLATLPSRLVLPRRGTPRLRVPPGSVAIAGRQTAVYPIATPGGWHLLGRTELVLWDPAAPGALAPGDLVRFVPVGG